MLGCEYSLAGSERPGTLEEIPQEISVMPVTASL